MIVNLPFYIHTKVNSNFINGKDGIIDCYIFAATAIRNRPLLFTIHTEHGAVYSRLPIEAFGKKQQKWGCMGDDIQAIELSYLKDYTVQSLETKQHGRYLMSFDTFHGGFAQDPEQQKILHLIQFNDGMELLTNNECLFLDLHFVTDTTQTKTYKRNTTYWEAKS